MICPRCDSKEVKLLVKAPENNAWEVYICNTCIFSWRSTESENITDPEKYDARFKIHPSEFDQLPLMPPIPPLRK